MHTGELGKGRKHSRYIFIVFRTYVESVAFYNGEKAEQERTENFLKRVLRTSLEVFKRQFWMNCK